MLDPNGGEIIDTPETDSQSATINAIGFSTVVEWVYTLSPVGHEYSGVEGVNFSFTPAGMSFIVEYYDDEGLFPFQYIDYLNPDREQVRVFDQLELPDPEVSPYIIEMREDDKDLLDWELDLTAIGLDTAATPAPKEANAKFILRVRANYDVSKEKLKEGINARRSITG